jgi:DNA repair protein RecN (Recombination protein N)
MLKFLNIKNFAVIESLQIEFQEGLNLLTGETGSGKSIIVDALGLLLGGRSSTAQIRTGETRAVIEGLFNLTGRSGAEAERLLGESPRGETESYELLIRRELYANSRNRIFVNGKVAQINTLRALQPLLVEIHGQGEQRALLSTHSHRELLDHFAGCLSLREQVSEAYNRWRAAREALTALEREAAERERASDLLQYQLSEIETLAPRAGEDEELQAERKLLTHVETALQLASGAYLELYESDDSILTRLAAVRKSLEELGRIDSRLNPASEMLEQQIVTLSDLADTLRDYGAKLEFSPTRLAEVENRLADLERLKRKYNSDLNGVLEILDELSGRLTGLNERALKEPQIRADFQAAEKEYKILAEKLSDCRRRAKSRLEQRVMSDLRHVAMENAQFIVAISGSAATDSDAFNSNASDNASDGLSIHNQTGAGEVESNFSPYGIEQVEFLLSANPGESPRPLAHVASGGELSRLMLTLRTTGAGGRESPQGVETLIFDEIDVGIGGRVAEAVGRRLKALSAGRQVLCVTHQPQIARFADQHYLIEKLFEKNRTRTRVKVLSLEERVGELARMIGGDEEVQTARETARWLLDDSDKKRGRSAGAKKSSKL